MSSPPKTAKPIFLAAIEAHAPGQWPVFLDQACGDDAQLRHRVEVLLEAHVEDGSLLDNPAVRPAATLDQPPPEQPGAVIGLYKLRELLGEGGMGSVYVAEQQEPIRRKVAVKIIKPGSEFSGGGAFGNKRSTSSGPVRRVLFSLVMVATAASGKAAPAWTFSGDRLEDNFNTGVFPGWSVTPPRPSSGPYLGSFTTETVRLGLMDFSQDLHGSSRLVDLSFDLIGFPFAIGSFQVANNGHVLLDRDFASFPSSRIDLMVPSGNLSLVYASGSCCGDLFLDFTATNLTNGSWGMDNVELDWSQPYVAPGDFNNNGIVDAADYTVWRNGLGTTYTQADYNVWRAHFGETAGSGAGLGANSAVPEPATLVLLIVGMMASFTFRRATASFASV